MSILISMENTIKCKNTFKINITQSYLANRILYLNYGLIRNHNQEKYPQVFTSTKLYLNTLITNIKLVKVSIIVI